MTFSEALNALKEGKRVMRDGWNLNRMREGTQEPRMYVQVQFPDNNSMNRKPYTFIVPEEGARVPWFPSNADLFADDWSIVA